MMKEFWELTLERGIATVSVWGLETQFALPDLTLSEHRMHLSQLDQLARARSGEEARLSEARAVRDVAFGQLREIIVRLPAVIEGMIGPESDLHSQLRLVYTVSGPFSDESALRRGDAVLGLWNRFNAELPQGSAPLGLKQNGSAALTASALATLLGKTCVQARQKVADAERNLNMIKSQLMSLESKVDQNNKRWYKAWVRNYEAGTPEGDAARLQIPIEQGNSAPTPQEISGLYPQPDQRIWVDYVSGGGSHATSLDLEWRIGSESAFTHCAPVRLPSQFIGPFPKGSEVTVRTRASNATHEMVLGGERSATVAGGTSGRCCMEQEAMPVSNEKNRPSPK